MGIPLIGITCSRVTGGAWGQYSLGHFMDYTYSEYSQVVRYCGGAPVIIPEAQDTKTLKIIMGKIDALILSGGPDIHPRFYGEQVLPGLGEVDEDLDRMELDAARTALQRGIPVLAICRGIQTLNVAQGGTLYQDIPTHVPDSINHAPKIDKGALTHRVQIERKTLLYRILRATEIWTNGKHHQAVKDVAPGLTISARASDGIVEAIEDPFKGFVLGVQWHPEGTWKKDPPSEKLFRGFISAASAPRKRK